MSSNRIRFVDLFCGGGGWTEGLYQAGYECVYSVDNWRPACRTHSLNHPGIPEDDVPKDIMSKDVFDKVAKLIEDKKIDILIGSPPCTQFSFANRGGKGNIVEGMVLVRRYLELIRFIQQDLKRPDFPWVMENVPRLAVFLERERLPDREHIYQFNYLEDTVRFYEIDIPRVSILNSADYGAPERRKRVFCGNFDIPRPTHIDPHVLEDFEAMTDFKATYGISEAEAKGLRKWRTMAEVLKALPDPREKPSPRIRIKDPNFDFMLKCSALTDHFYNTDIKAGLELYESQELKQHHPVYGVMNFPDDVNQTARTIMATETRVSRETIIIPVDYRHYKGSFTKRSYSEMLKDFETAGGFRRLTIREIACLQGFPITYQFDGESSGTKHKIVGNAVPVFFSRAFAESFRKSHFLSSTRPGVDRYGGPKDVLVYDKVSDWQLNGYKQNSYDFFGHVRSTKESGERVDLRYSPKDSRGWRVILTLGSGKEYRSYEANQDFLDSLIEKSPAAQFGLWDKDQDDQGVALNAWKDRINRLTQTCDIRLMKRFCSSQCFDRTGRYKRGSPFYYTEEGIEKLVKKLTKSRYYSLRTTKMKIRAVTKTGYEEVTLHALATLFATYALAAKVNAG